LVIIRPKSPYLVLIVNKHGNIIVQNDKFNLQCLKNVSILKKDKKTKRKILKYSSKQKKGYSGNGLSNGKIDKDMVTFNGF
jgi:hypothetical protein